MQEVWGYDYFGGTRTVDVHVRRLRAKLGPEHEAMIGTVRNVGYKFVRPAGEQARRLADPVHRRPTRHPDRRARVFGSAQSAPSRPRDYLPAPSLRC